MKVRKYLPNKNQKAGQPRSTKENTKKEGNIKYQEAGFVHLEARLAQVSVSDAGEDALAENVAVGLQGGVAARQDVQSSVELLHRVHRCYGRSSSVKNSLRSRHLLNFSDRSELLRSVLFTALPMLSFIHLHLKHESEHL